MNFRIVGLRVQFSWRSG